MLKAAGLFLIVAAGAGLGFSESRSLSKREQALSMLLRTVVYLKGEIRYGGTSLADALLGAAEKLTGVYTEFLKALGKRMQEERGSSFGKLFRECGEKYLSGLKLTREEQEEFFSLGEHLGYLDMDMQLKQLALYEQSLTFQIEELKRELPGKKKVYQSLGILGGLLLAILVW